MSKKNKQKSIVKFEILKAKELISKKKNDFIISKIKSFTEYNFV